MKKASLLLLLAACAALADVGLKQGSTVIGPVRDISCASDGGLLCTRTTATSRGNLFCNGASATEPGCLLPDVAQTLSGDKSTTGNVRIIGHVHGSLTACDASHKGTWQTCTTHNAPVFCNGTSNVELGGTTSAEQVLWSIHVDGVPVGFMGATVLSGAGAVVNAIEGTWGSGTTSGTLTFRITDGVNNCDCPITCNAPTTRTACAGTCAFASGVTLTPIRASSTCALDPVVIGNVQVMGTRQ